LYCLLINYSSACSDCSVWILYGSHRGQSGLFLAAVMNSGLRTVRGITLFCEWRILSFSRTRTPGPPEYETGMLMAGTGFIARSRHSRYIYL